MRFTKTAAFLLVGLLPVGCRERPDPPSVPDGPRWAVVGETLQFTVEAPGGADAGIMMRMSWNDGDSSDWTDFVAAGTRIAFFHSYDRPGSYCVRARARSTTGHKSGQSEPAFLEVLPSPGYPDRVVAEFEETGAYLTDIDYFARSQLVLLLCDRRLEIRSALNRDTVRSIWFDTSDLVSMVLLPDQRSAYIGDREGKLWRVDVRSGEVLEHRVVECNWYNMVLDPSGTVLYSTCRGGGHTIYVVRTADWSVDTVTVQTGYRWDFYDIALSLDGRRLYATVEIGWPGIAALAADGMEPSVTTITDWYARDLAADDDCVYVTSEIGVHVFDAQTLALKTERLVPGGATTLALAASGRALYALTRDAILVYRLPELEPAPAIPVPWGTYVAGVSTDGRYVYYGLTNGTRTFVLGYEEDLLE